MKRLGYFLRGSFRGREEVNGIERKLERALHKVPLAVKCLDQAIVTWFWLNVNGHKAILRIGVSVTPLESHAWVVLGNKVFVEATSIPDLSIVAEYESWAQ